MLKIREKKKSKLGLGHFGSWVGGVAIHCAGLYQEKIRFEGESRILPWACDIKIRVPVGQRSGDVDKATR